MAEIDRQLAGISHFNGRRFAGRQATAQSGTGDTPANGLQRRCRALLLRGVVLKDAQDGRVTDAQLARNHARGCAVGVLGEHLGDLDAVDARCAVVSADARRAQGRRRSPARRAPN